MPFFDQYPYTNFHNVNLDWVLERVKEWGKMVEDNNTRFENLQQANEDFKAYVTNYIENLDYQAAIDDKLDRMFESGELTEYLQPYISPVVTTWLDQNITEPVGVVIDSSLTVSGAAADAKAVGVKIALLQNDIDDKGLNIATRNAMIDFFKEIALFNSNSAVKFDTLKNLLLGEFISTWEFLSFNDVFSSIGYANPAINNGVFTKIGTEVTFSAVVFRPYIKHARMRILTVNNSILPNTVYKIISGEKIEIMNRYTKRYELTKANTTKYSITSTLENVNRNPGFTATNEYLVENGKLKIINGNNILTYEVENANIMGFWSDSEDYITQAVIEKRTVDFKYIKITDILYHGGERSFSIDNGVIHTGDKTFNAIVLKREITMFDGTIYNQTGNTKNYNTYFVYWTNDNGSVLHCTDGVKTFEFIYNTISNVYEAVEKNDIGVLNKTVAGNNWNNGRATLWTENNIFYAMYNNIFISVTDSNCIGVWGSDLTSNTYIEGRVM